MLITLIYIRNEIYLAYIKKKKFRIYLSLFIYSLRIVVMFYELMKPN